MRKFLVCYTVFCDTNPELSVCDATVTIPVLTEAAVQNLRERLMRKFREQNPESVVRGLSFTSITELDG